MDGPTSRPEGRGTEPTTSPTAGPGCPMTDEDPCPTMALGTFADDPATVERPVDWPTGPAVDASRSASSPLDAAAAPASSSGAGPPGTSAAKVAPYGKAWVEASRGPAAWRVVALDLGSSRTAPSPSAPDGGAPSAPNRPDPLAVPGSPAASPDVPRSGSPASSPSSSVRAVANWPVSGGVLVRDAAAGTGPATPAPAEIGAGIRHLRCRARRRAVGRSAPTSRRRPDMRSVGPPGRLRPRACSANRRSR